MKTRSEKDSLGTVNVPLTAYFGSATQRALDNFHISELKAPNTFKRALGIIKLAAAQTHEHLGLLKKNQAKAIKQACQEFIDGKFDEDFTLDAFQAGAGTSYNMNANEIIANRANELLGGKKGEYKYVHPNNDVNMGQSTNDVIPTVTRLATLLLIPDLLKALAEAEKEFAKIAATHKSTVKVGRTHLMDAVPISLGQEFDSYKEALQKSKKFIETQSKELLVLGIGGTAVGTGINAHPKYKDLIVKNLKKLTGLAFTSGKNLTEVANNMNDFLNFSASLRSLTSNLLNISGDLKLMNMGPKAGISEITLPEVQAGSSIMPGKVNPSIIECLEMICMQTLGNDKVIEIAAQKSQFELNVYCPIIMKNLLESISLLTNGLKTLTSLALRNLSINTKQIRKLFEHSVCTATALNPHLGYDLTAEIVKSALKKEISIKEEVISRKLLNEKQIDEILDKSHTIHPSISKKS